MAEVTLKEKAYSMLKKRILTGEFRSGEQLVERILVEKLEMSRTPIRQALERLEVEGFVSYTPNKGIIITDTQIDRIVDFFDFRKMVESHIVNILAERKLEASQVELLKQNLEEQRKCMQNKDYAKFTEFDMEFHTLLCTFYGNVEVIENMERVRDKLYLFAQKVLRKDPTGADRAFKEHSLIMEAMIAGKSKEAEKLMSKHMENGIKILAL